MRRILLSIVALATLSAAQADKPIYLDSKAPIEQRVEDAFKRLTIEEKVALCHAQSKFSIKGVPRLGIPELWMSDGPHGVRAEISWDDWGYSGFTNDSCTAFPALTCLAASWNPSISALYGRSVGAEARFRKKDVLLGPGVNICRTPLNGRNFEYMGEDPYLASKMVVPYIQEAQKNGIATCVKHFALNNQELSRMSVDVSVSERALREIYLPAFHAAATEGGSWGFMGSYNKYLGEHGCHNHRLTQQILKGEWGFDGAMISDWGGTHDSREAALNGLDIEMGTGSDGLTYSLKNAYDNYNLATPYLDMLRRGEVPLSTLDDKARRVLRLILRTVMSEDRPWGSFATEEHAQAARKIAQEGIVLLKNDGILPLAPGRTIAVVGDNATRSMSVGGGSSELKPWREISPLQAIEEAYGEQNVSFSRGYHAGPAAYGRVIPSPLDADSLRQAAIQTASKADVVIFVGGLNKNHQQDCEDGDRTGYELPFGQQELIEQIAAVNPNVVVVLISGCAVETLWEPKAKAIVQAWYCGSEAGHAITDILTGAINPSGKLPISFYAKLSDCGAHAYGPTSYPGVDNKQSYKEGIFVGYRRLAKEKIRAKFPFGFGLSYTTFSLFAPTTDSKIYTEDQTITVNVTLKNTGLRQGSEVVQIYSSKPNSSVERSPRELKGFEKVNLEAGQSKTVEVKIPVKSLAYWSEQTNGWQIEKGEYKLYVGNSSEANSSVQIKIK